MSVMITDGNGDKHWLKDDKFYREDGPAVECVDGTQWWYRDGKLHEGFRQADPFEKIKVIGIKEANMPTSTEKNNLESLFEDNIKLRKGYQQLQSQYEQFRQDAESVGKCEYVRKIETLRSQVRKLEEALSASNIPILPRTLDSFIKEKVHDADISADDEKLWMPIQSLDQWMNGPRCG